MGRYLLFTIIALIQFHIFAQSRFERLVEKGYDELREGHLPEAKYDLEKAVSILPKNNDLQETAILHNNLGVLYYQLGAYKKGIDEYTISLHYYKKVKNDTLTAQSLLNLGLSYKEIGAFDHAMKKLIAAARIFEKNGIIKELAATWNAIGNIQRELKNFEKALQYHYKALALRRQIKYDKGIADSYHNIGAIYLDDGQQYKAEWYLQESLKQKRKLGNEWNTLTTLTLLGQLYVEKNQLEKALSYLNTAYNMREASNSVKVASSLYYLGTYYSKTGDRSKALESFSQAEKLAKISEDYQLLEDIIKGEIKLIEDRNSTILTKKYKELISVREQIVSKENQKTIALLEITYDVERKDNEIRIKKVELENQRLHNRQLTIWLFGAVIIIILAIIAWYFLRKRKHYIENQNVILEKQKQEITHLHRELSHRTKNYFGMLSGILKSDKSNIQHPETIEVLEENIRRLDAMSLIQHYLLDDSTKHNTEVRLDTYLKDLIESITINLSTCTKVHISIEPLHLDYDISMRLALILNELLCNAIEHGFSQIDQPEITVTVWQEDKGLLLIVKDNGRGISEQYMKTENVKGLSLITKLLQNINGTIAFRNDHGCIAEVLVKL